MNLQKTKAALVARGYDCEVFADRTGALAWLKSHCSGKSVGMGGSRTLTDMDAYAALSPVASAVYSHATVPGRDTMFAANKAEVYLCSANAMTEDGIILNIDGNANRVGSTLMGPAEVIFVVGRNKIAPDLENALLRLRKVAAPLNAKRFGCKTPCVVDGECDISRCPPDISICGQTVIMEKPGRMVGRYTVLLINEDIGF